MNESMSHGPQAGALNLLKNCLAAKPGQSVLIIGEEGPLAHYDRTLCDVVFETAATLGLKPSIVIAPETRTAADLPAGLADAIAEADHTVFFARMADQLRFLGVEGGKSMTACYTLEPSYLGDTFARVDHRLFLGVHNLLLECIKKASRYAIRCPDGTDLTGDVGLSPDDGGPEEFAVKPFPVMIFPPVDGSALSGKIALAHPLTSSSTNIYEDSVFVPASPVMGTVENGSIVAFEGEPAEARRMQSHFERVGALVGGDPFAINSWHAGINPRNYSHFDAATDPERWGTAIFGSPRITHFHACGSDPGDIAISLFDATISFDGEIFWEEGRFAFLDHPEVRALLDVYPGNEAAFEMRWDIGVARRSAA